MSIGEIEIAPLKGQGFRKARARSQQEQNQWPQMGRARIDQSLCFLEREPSHAAFGLGRPLDYPLGTEPALGGMVEHCRDRRERLPIQRCRRGIRKERP
ncbi:MAG TPA: hypothetical protein VFI58_00620, partial [Xanthobacteraceae bacterium]|nr:hypothetical protein [Xanthobacteraceae bacterium]